MSTGSVRIDTLDGVGAAAHRGVRGERVPAAYAQRIASGDPFCAPEAFLTRFDTYVVNPALSMVAAVTHDEWVGQAWGWPLTPRSRWSQGLRVRVRAHV